METTDTLIVTESGARLDRYISDHRADLSRATVQRLIDDAQIKVDGATRKASYRVRAGETIRVHVPPPEPARPRAEAIPLDILYEDADVLVVNKPAGMVVHPAAGHSSGTLVNAVLAHSPGLSIGGVERPGIVHRLDRDTSGIIVIAKNDSALRDLQAQFKSHRVRKKYLALVEGRVKPPRGKIDAPVGRDPKRRQRMAVIPNTLSPSLRGRSVRGLGRDAVTVYRTIASLGESTLVEAEPHTGRTHQIRVHLAFLGFPVVADGIYGRKKNSFGLTRQFLHAAGLTLTLPGDQREVSFTAPLPPDLRRVLEALGFDPHAL
jgi:23S rRNA pseudouridine1911/1915/1917 synthase